MGVHGIIQHQPGYYYITLEEDYVALFEQSAKKRYEQTKKTDKDTVEYKARLAHAVAKAYISSVLEHLSDQLYKERESEKGLWVFLSFPELEKRLHGAKSIRTLKDAMKEMIEDGYVMKRDNSNPQYVVKEYQLNLAKYRAELTELPRKADKDYRANLHDSSAELHDVNAELHDSSANLHTRVTNNKHIYKKEKNTTHLNVPIGNLSTGVSPSSSESESEQKPPISITSKRGRPKKEYTPGEVEVLDEWDRINGMPDDRNDRTNRDCATYLASLIEDGHANLSDLERVKKKLNTNNYFKGNITLSTLKRNFVATLTGLKAELPQTAEQQLDNIPDWMREAMV